MSILDVKKLILSLQCSFKLSKTKKCNVASRSYSVLSFLKRKGRWSWLVPKRSIVFKWISWSKLISLIIARPRVGGKWKFVSSSLNEADWTRGNVRFWQSQRTPCGWRLSNKLSARNVLARLITVWRKYGTSHISSTLGKQPFTRFLNPCSHLSILKLGCHVY